MSHNELSSRLTELRALMRKKGATHFWLRATDVYLNEYVPKDLSRRVYVTGFTGSLGDAIIGLDSATLFVDGRYALQGKSEATEFNVKVLPLGESIESACLKELRNCKKGDVVLVEDDCTPESVFAPLAQLAKDGEFTLRSDGGIVEELRQSKNESAPHMLGKIWQADPNILGTSVADRLATIDTTLKNNHVDGYLLVALDDIAWLSGFRGLDFAYQSIFAARALVLKDQLWLITPHSSQQFASDSHIRCFEKFEQAAAELGKINIGFDPSSTPVTLLHQLEATGIQLKKMPNPVQSLKVHKPKSEIDHLVDGFKRADKVVHNTQAWLCKEVMAGKRVSELDVSNYVSAEFARSGTVALSFTPICGYAKNAAIIHYSNPDPNIEIKPGEMFLLDTGGIYEGGYTTDLTRTFLVGDAGTKAAKAHQQMFTLVLKAAIIGMSARIPLGTTGVQLDAMVRAPLWQNGLNFAHGTGHGLGINVHEFPPRVATVGHAPIEVGHVFSIEPGLYFPNFGGVRIENMCTAVPDPQKGKGFLRVVPLTFSPLDERLIDYEMLSEFEKNFLKFFKKRFESSSAEWNEPFPLDEQASELMLTD